MVRDREDQVHRVRAANENRPDLLPVDGLCGHSAAVADQARDVLDRNVSVGEQRDEAVPQFARRPLPWVEACGLDYAAEGTPDMRGIRGRTNLRREHQVVVLPLAACRLPDLILPLSVIAQGVYAALRQGQRPP